ncbi:MAG: DUF3365 domain-containing protein [Betaproteobacteria bacterium]|nr:DUF3365 domain-containing protein [Betaproteobacteria bacterium]
MKRYLVLAGLLPALIHVNTLAGEPSDFTLKARGIAGQLVQELGAGLKKEMSSNGPASAISACKNLAPEIAGRLSREHGARVARVSLKVRNPLLGQADSWEQSVLASFDRVASEKPEALEYSEIVTEPQGRYFRYMKAIPVQPLCLSCHGSPEAIPGEVKAILAKEYPHDQATGYSTGQIRGAVTIKQRLD